MLADGQFGKRRTPLHRKLRKRRQRGKEAAAKTGEDGILLVLHLPSIWIVSTGPAAIQFIKVLGPMTK
jgi:hypothetical protein